MLDAPEVERRFQAGQSAQTRRPEAVMVRLGKAAALPCGVVARVGGVLDNGPHPFGTAPLRVIRHTTVANDRVFHKGRQLNGKVLAKSIALCSHERPYWITLHYKSLLLSSVKYATRIWLSPTAQPALGACSSRPAASQRGCTKAATPRSFAVHLLSHAWPVGSQRGDAKHRYPALSRPSPETFIKTDLHAAWPTKQPHLTPSQSRNACAS
jgi:hypothetical protein